MIDYYSGSMFMECDGHMCDNTLEMEGDFLECIQEAKDKGWKIICVDDNEYEHFCPRCWSNRGAEGVFE